MEEAKCIFQCKRSQSEKCYILYDSNYVTFCKGQNCRDKKKSLFCRGWRKKGWIGRMGNSDIGYGCMGARGTEELSILSIQFYCELKNFS